MVPGRTRGIDAFVGIANRYADATNGPPAERQIRAGLPVLSSHCINIEYSTSGSTGLLM